MNDSLSTSAKSTSTKTGKRRRIASWTIRALLAAVFIGAGGAKLAGVPLMVEVFDQIGLGQGYRYLTGLVEIIGAIGLFVPGMTVLAALWLGTTMAGAILAHLFFLPTSAAPAIVLFVFCAVLAWLHRDQVQTLKDRWDLFATRSAPPLGLRPFSNKRK